MPDRTALDELPILTSGDLVLEPLIVAHAPAMFDVLSDPALYRYLDQPPPASVDALRVRYAKLEARRSPDGSQGWLNWIVCAGGTPIGFVQATVVSPNETWIAYLVGVPWQRRGHARTALNAMLRHLTAQRSARRFMAIVECDNAASVATLRRLDFRPLQADEVLGCEPTATERVFVREVDLAER